MSDKNTKVPFEEALDRTGFGRYNYLMFGLCGSLVTSMVFEGMSMSYLVPASACELGTDNVQQGIMAGTPMIGVLATSHMWGYLADTRGRQPVLAVSLLLGFTFAFLSAFSPNWIVFSLLKLVSCSSVSGTYALAITMLSECTPAAQRGPMVILTTGLFLLASGVMAMLAIPVLPLEFSHELPVLNIPFNSWRLLAILYSIPCLFGAFGVYSTWESPKYLASIGQEEKALHVLQKVFLMNHPHASGEDSYKVESLFLEEQNAGQKATSLWGSIKSQTLPLIQPPLLKDTVILSIIYVVIYLCTNPYFMWLPSMADSLMRSVQAGNTNLTFCKLLQSSYKDPIVNEPRACTLNAFAMTIVLGVFLMVAFFNTIIGSVIHYCGRKHVLAFVLIISGVSGICINFHTNWILTAVMFVGLNLPALNFGIITTFTVDIYPTYLRAMAVCLTLMVGRASAVVGINILKNMLISNCEMSFYIFGLVAIGGACIVPLLPSNRDTITAGDQSRVTT